MIILIIFIMTLLIIFIVAVVFFIVLLGEEKNGQPDGNAQHGRRKPTRKQNKTLSREEKTVLKGAIGEQIIKVEVLSKLDPNRYRYFHNLIVPADGGSTQIDNVIVSPYGIFVIEAKYFQGWIFGTAGQPKWTHTLPSGSRFAFQNPLRQNYRHIRALAELLDISDKQFHSVVVFTHRRCLLKTELPENVCLVRDFIAYIKKHDQEILTMTQCSDYCTVLSNPDYEATPEKTEQHIQSLTQKKNGRCGNQSRI